MTDLNPEGLEKAARIIFEYDAPSHDPEEWVPLDEFAKTDYRATARAAVSAYLGHVEVTTCPGCNHPHDTAQCEAEGAWHFCDCCTDIEKANRC